MAGRPEFTPLQYWSCYGQLPKEVADVVTGNEAGYFPLPTEAVITPMRRPVLVQTGRYWYAPQEFGRDSGEFETGGRWDACRYFVEVYEDNGDDGHTEFRKQGYALMTNKMVGEYVNATFTVDRSYEFPSITIGE